MSKKGKPSYEDLQDKVKQLESKVKLLEGAMDSARRYSRYVTHHDVYRGVASNFWAWVLFPC